MSLAQPNWLTKALNTFPELSSKFSEKEIDTPYSLWSLLREEFASAYSRTPANEHMIRRVYQFSYWCCKQPEGNNARDDLGTCVCVCFYEHIAEHPDAAADMPRWWKHSDFEYEPNILTHRLSPLAARELKAYIKDNQHKYDPSLFICDNL